MVAPPPRRRRGLAQKLNLAAGGPAANAASGLGRICPPRLSHAAIDACRASCLPCEMPAQCPSACSSKDSIVSPPPNCCSQLHPRSHLRPNQPLGCHAPGRHSLTVTR
eukprot:scaffold1271_cov47-Phaeocystis_antarctica.AAC.1